jgi:proteic killer suppression protein
MIVRFRHKGLERLFTMGDTSGVSAQHVRKLQQILAFLNVSQEPTDMNLPGFRLHP